MTESTECVVIGGGIIGLAVARALARAGREVLLLEKERWIGQDTSSRNSEVIHAGLYYPEASLKARFCVEGRKQLYAYCAERDVTHKRIGKLVVGVNDDEIATLKRVIKHAEAAGVTDLEWLSGDEAWKMEPALRCV
ncbi:MAG TPA: FAD-dependent oxidoreductase, partial [Stellaceae bacterium]|nr:FAD-dependent oxidoreductase [Stellaceae bacterium]